MSSHSPPPGVLADGRYTLTAPLGDGHFGEVWEGEDTHLGMSVAVKLFAAGFEPDTVLLEAQLQNRLSQHVGVISIHNVIVEPPRPFMVTDLCPEGSVGDRLKAGDVSLVQAMRWTRDMLAGLAHAHSLGVIHRDLKPSNLLILDSGRAAITDFGIAEDAIKHEYVDSSNYGPHMAPEVATGGSSSPQSDVWAAGCTWYRLLCGEYPFATLGDALAGTFEPVHHRNPQAPIAVSRAVAKGLSVDTANRYQDANQMLSSVSGLQVVNSWRTSTEPGTLETWTCSTANADYALRLTERPQVGLELTAHRDLRRGAGFRRVRSERPPSINQARQLRRRWLVAVVEGGEL